MDNLRDIYNQYFNVQNIIFIVVGDFKLAEMQALFKKELTHPKQGIELNPKCFSFSHKIIYLRQDIENTKVRIGFPSNTSTPYIHISAFVNLLHILLFTELLIDKLKKTIAKDKVIELIDGEEFYKSCANTPRSNCILDNNKLLSTGIKMSNIEDSIDYCLNNWK